MFYCWHCHKEVNMEVRITRFDTCEFCGYDLRVCFNCKFHDEGSPNNCKEPMSGGVSDRERGNTCGFFQFVEGRDHLQKKTSKDDIKASLDALFKTAK